LGTLIKIDMDQNLFNMLHVSTDFPFCLFTGLQKNDLTYVVCAGNKHYAYEIMFMFTVNPNYDILSKYRAVCVLFILASTVISL